MTDEVDFAIRLCQLVRFLEARQAQVFVESVDANPAQIRAAYLDMQAAIASKRRELQLDATSCVDLALYNPKFRDWLAQLDKALEHTAAVRLH